MFFKQNFDDFHMTLPRWEQENIRSESLRSHYGVKEPLRYKEGTREQLGHQKLI